jgi:hypothetical protein
MFGTFERLRVIQKFSYIVTMIRQVVIDLQTFMTIFIIVIVSLSNILDIVGTSNFPEYDVIGPLWGNLFATLRLGLGDFDFSQLADNSLYWMHVLFWVVWILMVGFASLIFLNFIIAEVSNSYEKCNEKVQMHIYKERAMLIAEGEDLFGSPAVAKVKYPEKFPKYFVCRESET